MMSSGLSSNLEGSVLKLIETVHVNKGVSSSEITQDSGVAKAYLRMKT